MIMFVGRGGSSACLESRGRHVTVKLTFVTMVTWLQLTGCLNMLYGIK